MSYDIHTRSLSLAHRGLLGILDESESLLVCNRREYGYCMIQA
jgi:hypothetical protein